MSLIYRTAAQLAQMIREQEISSSELLEAYLQQVEKYNPKINAVVAMDIENAKLRAQQADQAIAKGEIWGPLHGVPMTVKEAFNVAGLPTTLGVPLFKNHIAKEDSSIVKRLKLAGAVIWGKTNVPVSCYDWQCNNPVYGKTNNPWNINYSPGGSSGGSAAALAAGFTPLEIGSDVAGSIRVPAHFCGVCAIRSTENMISATGHGDIAKYPFSLQSLVSFGPMARSIEDLKLVMEIISGPDINDWRVPPIDHGETQVDIKDLRIAFSDELGGVGVSQCTRKNLYGFIEKLQKRQASVERTTPDIDFAEVLKLWGWIQGFELATFLPYPLRVSPLKWLLRMGVVQGLFGWGNFSRGLARGLTLSPRGYLCALKQRSQVMAKMEAFFGNWDIWILPVAATPAFAQCRTGAKLNIDTKSVSYNTAMAVYNCSTAVLGTPAVVLPIGTSQDGLPIAVQIHAKRWSDLRLLNIVECLRNSCDLGIAVPKME